MKIPRHEVIINGIAKDVCWPDDVEKMEDKIKEAVTAHRAGKTKSWWDDVKSMPYSEQVSMEIESRVIRSIPPEFYLETMKEISEILQKKYGEKGVSYCPALDDIKQRKLFPGSP